jgi:pimeloyl-ACP methyl ester carboxylesterase
MSFEQFSSESAGEKKGDFLERQFETRKKFHVAGGIAEVADIKPEKAKTDVPVFLAPAWGYTIDTYKGVMKTLAEENRRVLSLDHPRHGYAMGDVPKDAASKYPTEELRKAMNIIGVLEQKGIEKTDVIAHSEGAANAIIAAVLHPEKFRNIVLFTPAGLIGKDSFGRLLKGFSQKNKPAKSLEGRLDIDASAFEKTAAAEAMKYIKKNPLRALREAIGISQSETHELLRYLHEKGIGIVVMASVDDPVFPMDKMQKIVKDDMLDGFVSVGGKHGVIGEPSGRYVRVAEKMLTALEEKQNKKAETLPAGI